MSEISSIFFSIIAHFQSRFSVSTTHRSLFAKTCRPVVKHYNGRSINKGEIMSYEYRHVGHVYVDSGQIAIGDPCYTLGHPEDIGDGDLKLVRNDKGGWVEDENGDSVIEIDKTIGKLNAYSKFCAQTLSGDNPWGMVDSGTAFNTSTTHGDGSYKVTLVLDENGTQRGVYIDLDGSEPDITVHEPTISWDDDDTFE